MAFVRGNTETTTRAFRRGGHGRTGLPHKHDAQIFD
jgi:hypothetical protein